MNKKYIVYLLRWQTGILFATPILWLLQVKFNFSIFVSFFIWQLIGANIYWVADKYIFTKL